MKNKTGLAALCMAALGMTVSAQNLSIKSGGVTRTYVLHVPAAVPANPPLMFVLCGHGMTGAQQQKDTQMDKIADRDKFITVYPDAIDMNWDQSGTSDFVFYLALLDSIDAKYHVDRNRVYAAGFSQGAGMTHAVGCGYADKFAAIAPVSGNIPAVCAPKRAIPMFLTFGTKDIATPDKFMASAAAWAKLDECPATPTVMRPYPSTNPNSLVTRITYAPCKNGTEVIADSIKGGPHEWPMDTQTKVNNSEEVWAFFKKFTLTGTTAIAPGAARRDRPDVAAFYSRGSVRLRGVGESAKIRILDARGRLAAVSGGTEALGGIAFPDQPGGVYQVLVSEKGRVTALKVMVP
jgi:polyhydroxybutyrate depolymerase